MPVLGANLGQDMAFRSYFPIHPEPRNNEHDSFQVICAWPLSGQYGTGSRVLYYILVTACIVARKYEWLREACIAAVLLLPAVAALHGIVLAAVHADGAVDMDMYGAFQLCAIGILAAPVTVRLSQTYFDRPGRNAIFLWTGIIVAGLVSLTIEFYRTSPEPCQGDEGFKYGREQKKCGLDCSRVMSPLRTGSVDDIYIVPEPTILTFGTATLLTAALCVHGILWLLSMLDKILEDSSSKYRRGTREYGEGDDPIQGTNGATRSGMARINEMVKRCLSVAVVPVFMAAGLSILIVGERNFFSKQLAYRTEPIRSVGQWAPIAAASLAVIGSLYLLLAKDMERLAKEEETGHHTCSHCPSINMSAEDIRLRDLNTVVGVRINHQEDGPGSPRSMRQSSASLNRHQLSGDLSRTTSEAATLDAGRRRTIAKAFVKASKILGMVAREWTDDTDFQRGRAQDFPEIPGEEYRSRNLSRIRTQYNRPRDYHDAMTPAGTARSRASSFAGSARVPLDQEESSARGRSTTQTEISQPSGNADNPSHALGSIQSKGDERRAIPEVARSPENDVGHLESPTLLEVPRLAFVSDKGNSGETHQSRRRRDFM